MPIPGQSQQKKRGIGHWYGKKQVVPSTDEQKARKVRFAKFQEDLAAERARVEALKNHPDLECSACGQKFVGAPKCPKGCLRGHGVVKVPHAVINEPIFAARKAEADAAAKAAEDAKKAELAAKPAIAPSFPPSPPSDDKNKK
jgi:hypothetical protein